MAESLSPKNKNEQEEGNRKEESPEKNTDSLLKKPVHFLQSLSLLDYISLGILAFAASIIFVLKISSEGPAMALGGFFGAFLSCAFVWLVLVVASIPLKYLSLRPSKSLLFFLAALMAFVVYTSMSYLRYEKIQNASDKSPSVSTSVIKEAS